MKFIHQDRIIFFFVHLKMKVFVMSLFALAGCETTTYTSSVAEEMDKTVAMAGQDSGASPIVPESIMDVLLPSLGGSSVVVEKTPDKFDISVANISARDFFEGLVGGSEYNIVVHPDVSGEITLELFKVSVDNVLEVVRDLYGYEYKKENAIYTIYPRKMRTEIFHIDYLNVHRVGLSDTSVLIGEITSNDEDGGSNSSNESDSDNGATLSGLLGGGALDSGSGGGSGGSTISTAGPGSRIQTTTETDFWSGLRLTVLAIIGGSGGEKLVVVTPQAGLVVVRALPEELNAVRGFLEKSEISVKRQVILEAKILEVELNGNYQSGINWSSISGNIQSTKNIDKDGFFDDSATGAGGVFTSIVGVDDISNLLKLLKSQGDVKVLSSPRISTVNNQKAIIRVGTDEFFVTGISGGGDSSSSSGTTVSSIPDVELSSFFSGIALDVTPQIAADGEIILHVHPVVSNVTDQNKELILGDKAFTLPLAVRDIRESDSIVKARSGQVVVLGGLMQERVVHYHGSRPLLSSLPIVGAMFDSDSNSSVKTELVILLQPYVANDKAWYQSLEKTRNVFSAFDQ